MATEKKFNTRIILKHDTLANWNSDASLILKEGEIALAKVDTNKKDPISGELVKVPTYLIKVGDGTSKFSALNWVAAPAADVHDWAKKDEATFTTWVKGLISVDDINLSDYYTKNDADGKFVAKETGKSLIEDTKITKLDGISEGATKVEASENGKIKINGVDTTVYTHPEKHAIDDVTGLQGALDNKVAKEDGKGLSANDLTDELKNQYDAAYAHSQIDHAPANAQANIIEAVKVNGTALIITDKAVDITVPTGDLADKDKVAKTDLEDTLKTEIDGKVVSIAAGDGSVAIAGTATAPTVAVKLDPSADNAIKLNENGLKVEIGAAPEYTIVKAADSGDYAAVYNLTKDGTIVGASINIPKDMVVKSGSVVGDEIVLVLNDEAATEIKIPVASLIEYVTSGSAADDMVVVHIDDDHKVTATITDGTVTLGKLTTEVQTAIGKAHDHENKNVLDGISATNIEDWNDAVSKEHTHTFVESELNKIADGDVAKWNATAENLGQYAKTEDLGELADLDTITHEKVTDFADAVKAVKVNEATKATQDGNGKNIADTYATKAEATYTAGENILIADDRTISVNPELTNIKSIHGEAANTLNIQGGASVRIYEDKTGAAINVSTDINLTPSSQGVVKINNKPVHAIATSGNVNDLVQTEGDVLIFDCGGSGVTA